MTTGQRIAAARKAAGYRTVYSFCMSRKHVRHWATKQGHLSQIERGLIAKPQQATLVALAKAFGVKVENLTGDGDV